MKNSSLELIKKLAYESLESKWNYMVKNKNKTEHLSEVNKKCSFCYWFHDRMDECIVPDLLCRECINNIDKLRLMYIINKIHWNIAEADLEMDYIDYEKLKHYYIRGVYLMHKNMEQLVKTGMLSKLHKLELKSFMIVADKFINKYEKEFIKRSEI